MKLAIQNTSHVWGGNEKWLATLADGLVKKGHDVVVSCAGGPVTDELRARGIRTTPFRPRGTIDFVSGLTFGGWLAVEKPDTLLMTSWQPTPWATFAARAAGIDRIVMRLGIVRDFPDAGLRSLALRNVDALIVNSSEIREKWLATAGNYDEARVHVVLNGVRSRIHERDVLRASLRNELGLSEKTILIGGAGHVAVRKGFDYLLRAFAAVGDPLSHVAIVGDGPIRPDLEKLARELGVNNRVTWLGNRNDGAGLIAGLDVFVLSSHNEGMANVMLEAMAGGTPVIASDVSGVATAIGTAADRPAAGWIVPAANVDALASTLRNVIAALREDGGSVERTVREAHWRASTWFSAERMVEECETILFGSHVAA